MALVCPQTSHQKHLFPSLSIELVSKTLNKTQKYLLKKELRYKHVKRERERETVRKKVKINCKDTASVVLGRLLNSLQCMNLLLGQTYWFFLCFLQWLQLFPIHDSTHGTQMHETQHWFHSLPSHSPMIPELYLLNDEDRRNEVQQALSWSVYDLFQLLH